MASDYECQTLPYVGLEHIEKGSGNFSTDFVRKPETLLATKFKFTPRHVLYGKLRPYLNKVALPHFEGVCTTEILPILPFDDKLERGYLWGFLLTPKFVSWASRVVSGANLPRLSPSDLHEYEIPLPSLLEQKRLAAILAKADRLRRLRRYALAVSDTYLQTVFLEMFGDPATNPKNWPVAKLGEAGKLDRGRSRNRPRNAPELYGGKYPFIQTGDVANATWYIRTFSQTYSELGLSQSKLWPKNTLCITIAANIARTAILTFDSCFPDSVVGFQPNAEVNVEYVQQWFTFVQKAIEDAAPESAQKNINLEILRALDIPLPPLPLQQKFAQIVQKHERLRAQQREAARQAEGLFGALLNRVFRGELSEAAVV